MWVDKGGKICRETLKSGEIEFFVGLLETGKNLVWKVVDTDPSLFVNFFQQAKCSKQSIKTLAR